MCTFDYRSSNWFVPSQTSVAAITSGVQPGMRNLEYIDIKINEGIH
jgi:hypothetical protein